MSDLVGTQIVSMHNTYIYQVHHKAESSQHGRPRVRASDGEHGTLGNQERITNRLHDTRDLFLRLTANLVVLICNTIDKLNVKKECVNLQPNVFVSCIYAISSQQFRVLFIILQWEFGCFEHIFSTFQLLFLSLVILLI